jgi:hypothetical protein
MSRACTGRMSLSLKQNHGCSVGGTGTAAAVAAVSTAAPPATPPAPDALGAEGKLRAYAV